MGLTVMSANVTMPCPFARGTPGVPGTLARLRCTQEREARAREIRENCIEYMFFFLKESGF